MSGILADSPQLNCLESLLPAPTVGQVQVLAREISKLLGPDLKNKLEAESAYVVKYLTVIQFDDALLQKSILK